MTPDIIPSRALTPQSETCLNRPPARAKDAQIRAYILEAARNMFVAHGRNGLAMRQFADATRLAQATIRGHVSDMHHLFGLILMQHLTGLIAAIGSVPSGKPDDQARRRAEYFRLTRGLCNVPTPLHFLWTRDRFSLPEDELEPLEQQRRIIGYLLGGDAWEEALTLLDCPGLDIARIEMMLAATGGKPAIPAPAPSKPAEAPRLCLLPTSLAPQMPRPAAFRASLFVQTTSPNPAPSPEDDDLPGIHPPKRAKPRPH